MSDPVVETTPEAPEVPAEPLAPADAPPVPEKDWKAEADKWKALSRKNEDTAKANAAAALKLKEIEDRDLSEIERLKRDHESASTQLAELQRQNTMLAKGIPLDLIPPVNATADQIADWADKLVTWRVSPAQHAVPQPKPDQGQGARPIDPRAAEDAEYRAYFPENTR